MQPIIKLIKPTNTEVVLYLVIGVGLLVFSNIQRLWDYLSGGVELNEALAYSDLANQIQDTIYSFESGIDPRIADFTAWLVVGLLAVVIVAVAQKFIAMGGEDIKRSSTIRRYRQKDSNLQETIARWSLRLAGFVLLIFWVRVFFGVTYKEFSTLFFESVVNLGNPFAWVAMIYSVVIVGLGFYVFAICFRLIASKIRVFGN